MARRALMVEVDSLRPHPHKIEQAAQAIKDGQVVVYPTDTLYGLAAGLHSKEAVALIYRIRGLEKHKQLSLVCRDLSQTSRYAIIRDECYRVMRRLLPGPYTFILNATPLASKLGDKKRKTLGIRIPLHPVALALVEKLGEPLLSVSAHASESEDGKRLNDPRELGEKYAVPGVAMVLDAGILEGTPSTVIDWSQDEPIIVREGAGDLSEFRQHSELSW